MNSRKFHPYAHALRRRRREALNELRLAQTIAEEQEEPKVDFDDCDHVNYVILAMLILLIFLRILNAIFMEFVVSLLNKI